MDYLDLKGLVEIYCIFASGKSVCQKLEETSLSLPVAWRSLSADKKWVSWAVKPLWATHARKDVWLAELDMETLQKCTM